MKLSILIAEPRDIIRIGLHAIFATDERVATLYGASNIKELQQYLRSSSIDLIIINETLIADMTTLPSNRFVLLTSEFDIVTFLRAYKYGAKGYLLENSRIELFRILLELPPGTFLIEPSLTANIMEYLTNKTRLLINTELLTPREREIVDLLREGIDRQTITQRLNISSATLKTHMKNISRKSGRVAI